MAAVEKGPLIGHRMWRLSPNGFLISVVSAFVWPPMEPAEGDPDSATGGIYAFSSPSGYETSYVNYSCYGECWLWGKVIIHKYGYRAQYAYPKNLVILPSVSEMTEIFLASRYQVKVSRALVVEEEPDVLRREVVRVSFLTLPVGSLCQTWTTPLEEATAWLTFLAFVEAKISILAKNLPGRRFLIEYKGGRNLRQWPALKQWIDQQRAYWLEEQRKYI